MNALLGGSMNPDQDPNQPQAPAENPAPDVPQPPMTPEAPAPETPPAPEETPAPVAPVPETPSEVAPAPNPFGGAAVTPTPMSSDPASTTAPAAASPLASTPVPPSAPTPSGSKKKLIITIAVIVGVLALLGVAALVVLGMIFPSKSDYRDATTQFDVVSSAYSDLKSEASKLQYDISGSTTDTEFTNDSDAVTKSIQTFQDANKKLSTMKAVKVGDGQKLFDTYQTKIDAFVAYVDDLLVSLKSYRPLAIACDDVSTTTLLSECSSAFNHVGDLPNADLKQLVTSLKTQYEAALALKSKIDALTDPFGDQYDTYKALRDQSYDIQDKISSASSDFSSNASKHAKDIDPSTTSNALGDFLVKKAND